MIAALDAQRARTFQLGDRTVMRMGYGAMQLAGPGVFGPPKDRDAALAVLRSVVESGITHIDTSDFYGPHVTNQLIAEALHPYSDDLTIVTKVGAAHGADASWNYAQLPAELESRRCTTICATSNAMCSRNCSARGSCATSGSAMRRRRR